MAMVLKLKSKEGPQEGPIEIKTKTNLRIFLQISMDFYRFLFEFPVPKNL